MADLKALLLEVITLPENHEAKALSDNRFSTSFTRPNKHTGEPEEVVTAEYHVWTDEEAAAFGYFKEKGGLSTSNPEYTVYRIF